MSNSSQPSVSSDYIPREFDDNNPEIRMYSLEGTSKHDSKAVSRVVTTSGFNGDDVIILGESKFLKQDLLEALGLASDHTNNNLVPISTANSLTKVPSRKPRIRYDIAPAALGLSSFAATTFLLSLFNCGTRGISVPNVIIGMAFFYGGAVQLLAGMWEYAVGSSFGGLAFSSYAAFWMSYAAILTPSFGIAEAFGKETGMYDNAVGLYLLTWALFTFMLMMCTLKTTLEFFMLFFTLLTTFLLLAAHAFTGSANCQTAAGVFGVLTAFIAWYNGFKMMLNPQNSYFVIPSIWLPKSHVKDH